MWAVFHNAERELGKREREEIKSIGERDIWE